MRFYHALVFLLLATLIPHVSADIIAGKNTFSLANSRYAPNQTIEGTLNVSLENESNDFVKASIDYKQFKMLLSDFLKAQPFPAAFSCSPASCQSYLKESQTSELVQLQFTEANSSKLIGLNIKKLPDCSFSNVKISGLIFNMAGSFCGTDCSCADYCYPLPSIDVGNDNTVEWRYLEPSDNYFGLDQNYALSGTEDSLRITSGWEYCEKIKFVPAEKFNVSANVATSDEISLKIYNLNFTKMVAECTDSTLSNQQCSADFINKDPQDYYVCASGTSGNINYYSGAGNKGYGVIYKPSASYASVNGDFAINASYAAYTPLNHEIEINDEKNEDIIKAANEYIKKCNNSLASCLVPISIHSDPKGNLNLKSLVLATSCWSDTDRFSLIDEEKAKINMNNTLLDISVLNANSPNYGMKTISISIGEFYVYDTLEIAQVPIITSISPIAAIAGTFTNFSVKAYSPKNNKITMYGWDFGDGSTESSISPSMSHKYLSVGNFTLTVKATDSEGLTGVGTFKIMTAEPFSVIQQSLTNKKTILAEFNKQLSAVPLWYKDIFTSKFNINELNTILQNYEKEFKTATDLITFKQELDSFSVPERIEDTLSIQESLPVLIADDIKPAYVEKMGGGTYNTELSKETKAAIKAWQTDAGIKVSGDVKTAIKDTGDEEDIATILKIKINPPVNPAFLIIQLPSGVSFNSVKFMSNYGQKNLDGAIGIEFNEPAAKEISLAMPGKQDISTLTLYASPSLDSLAITVPEETECGNKVCDAGENTQNCPSDCPPFGSAIAYMALIAAAAVAGIFLIWKVYAVIYEKRQESRLFKSRIDLMSITTFIVNAQVKGVEEKEIREKLEKAGWNAEQIAFAFMKVKKRRREIERKIREAKKALEEAKGKEAKEKKEEAKSSS